MKHKLKIIPLGGVGEIGKNMTVIEYGNDILIIDCGLIFPDEEMPGIDHSICSTAMSNRKQKTTWHQRHKATASSKLPSECLTRDSAG